MAEAVNATPLFLYLVSWDLRYTETIGGGATEDIHYEGVHAVYAEEEKLAGDMVVGDVLYEYGLKEDEVDLTIFQIDELPIHPMRPGPIGFTAWEPEGLERERELGELDDEFDGVEPSEAGSPRGR
jgi:hypothetical protein